MQNDKIKEINSKKDSIIFLNQFIVLTDKRMMRFKSAINDLKKELLKYDENITEVSTEVYHRHQERIDCCFAYLLNLFGDETKTAVSYIQFRNVVNKKIKKGELDFKLNELDDEMSNILKEFREARNFTHHVPQSLLNSQIDYMREVSRIPEKIIELQFSMPEVCVMTWEYHDIKWLRNLYEKADKNYKMCSKIFQHMKKEYSNLTGESMRVVREAKKIARPYAFNAIMYNSFDINTRKRNKNK
ncbi:hypothetical protein [Clostridium sp. UBA1652]|uniref:hypothetical protein n=1 Tax=Clostridium sp. UBA1652 TaxID=1946348 RepID=UPI00257C7773|nr:hypothetical protein [Clostridium sp. UBA1652]